jgi:hypothetical protein
MANEKYTKKLLVEGNEDVHVILALWNHAKLPETFDVVDCHSITKLLENLKEQGDEEQGDGYLFHRITKSVIINS